MTLPVRLGAVAVGVAILALHRAQVRLVDRKIAQMVEIAVTELADARREGRRLQDDPNG